MTSDQTAAIEVVQEDLNSVIKFLTKPTMADIQGVVKVIDHIRIAQGILDQILLHSGSTWTREEVADRILRDSDD